MKRRGFFARVASAVAGFFGVPLVAVAASQDRAEPSGHPRFKIEYWDGHISLTPVLSHVVDHETRLRLAGPIREMEKAVWAALDCHQIPADKRSDREGICLYQAVATLQELRLALNRKYPW